MAAHYNPFNMDILLPSLRSLPSHSSVGLMISTYRAPMCVRPRTGFNRLQLPSERGRDSFEVSAAAQAKPVLAELVPGRTQVSRFPRGDNYGVGTGLKAGVAMISSDLSVGAGRGQAAWTPTLVIRDLLSPERNS